MIKKNFNKIFEVVVFIFGFPTPWLAGARFFAANNVLTNNSLQGKFRPETILRAHLEELRDTGYSVVIHFSITFIQLAHFVPLWSLLHSV